MNWLDPVDLSLVRINLGIRIEWFRFTSFFTYFKYDISLETLVEMSSFYAFYEFGWLNKNNKNIYISIFRFLVFVFSQTKAHKKCAENK